MRRIGTALVSSLLVLGAAPAVATATPATPAAQATPAATTAPATHHAPATDTGQRRHGSWRVTVLDADQNFRGLAAVSRTEVWVTGESLTDGAARIFHTTDGGRSWVDRTPPGTTGLSFRDVEVAGGAVNVLTIGPGEASRIYRSTDDGRTWTESFRNTDANAFYDCMAFYPGGRHGLAVSDPVDGKFRILSTSNGGRSWSVLPSVGMPDTTGEGAFAASGDCLVTAGRSAFIITGGAQSRVLRSDDRGRTWTTAASAIPAGDAAGGFALAFADPRHGIVVGGDFADPTDNTDAAAYTRDGGRTWTGGIDLTHVGEDVAFVGGGHRVAIATGTYRGSSGTSLTRDGGRTWQRLSDQGFHAVKCVPGGTCWGAGATGQVGVLRIR
ncbi:oxidoreductase [Arsenicicoccus piscis]|uniref:WD40/YVTN/BNR-like repeat-containing protein n=1 Tax=Arsenicicoccus piscis TaxID=673954 RepID=UPI001F4CFD84|nr:oxidoreductase [Arsenicicoccus piscis]MCH8629057.1 oxidoreductase [Arsenicicoccus piscis]